MLRVTGVGVLVLVAGLAAFVQVQQHLLRWRAERLLADIREIQMGKSTWADAQRLMDRWGKWGGYQGSCTSERCEYHIRLKDILQEKDRSSYGYLLHPYYLLGGRFATVGARIQVKNGAIWTKSFYAEVFSPAPIPFFGDGDYFLIGETGGPNSELDTDKDLDVFLPICTGCKMIDVEFSPFADSESVNRLLDFRLSCLTSVLVCRQPSDLMPAAWKYYSTHRETPERTSELSIDESFKKAGRDTKYIAVAEVIGIDDSAPPNKGGKELAIRTTESMKNEVPAGLVVRVPYPQLVFWRSDDQQSVEILKKGDRLVAFFDARPDQPQPNRIDDGLVDLLDFTNGVRGLLVLTPHNLGLVERGISLDKLADVP